MLTFYLWDKIGRTAGGHLRHDRCCYVVVVVVCCRSPGPGGDSAGWPTSREMRVLSKDGAWSKLKIVFDNRCNCWPIRRSCALEPGHRIQRHSSKFPGYLLFRRSVPWKTRDIDAVRRTDGEMDSQGLLGDEIVAPGMHSTDNRHLWNFQDYDKPRSRRCSSRNCQNFRLDGENCEDVVGTNCCTGNNSGPGRDC